VDIESFWDLAERAARLLPAAPTSGDTLMWMSWQELVWATASRLGAVGGHLLDDLGIAGASDCDESSVSAEQLVKLSVLLHEDSVTDAGYGPEAGAIAMAHRRIGQQRLHAVRKWS
jgi:hypothetical protein